MENQMVHEHEAGAVSAPDSPDALKTQRLRSLPDSVFMPARTQLIDLSGVQRNAVAADSHPGFLRASNEDSYGFYVSPDGRTVMLAVADGIGGHGNGDIASLLTIRMLLIFWREYQKNLPSRHEAIMADLGAEVCRINRQIYDLNVATDTKIPMGTTLAMLVLTEKYAITLHLGDSRVYLVRDRTIARLTEDHSFINELIKKGQLTEAQAAEHPLAHVILRSVGPAADVVPEISTYEKRHGDRYMVCSDGLNEHLSDPQILNAVVAAPNASDVVRTLIHATLRCGAKDNVTVLCAFQ